MRAVEEGRRKTGKIDTEKGVYEEGGREENERGRESERQRGEEKEREKGKVHEDESEKWMNFFFFMK